MAATTAQLTEAATQPILRTDPEQPEHSRRLQRQAKSGLLHRLTPGLFVDGGWWKVATKEQQHVALARAVHDRFGTGGVFSHVTAAVLQQVPLFDELGPRVHFIRPGSAIAETTMTSVQHADLSPDLRGIVRGDISGIVATDLLRTAVDVATTRSFDDSVIALDAILARGVLRADIEAALNRRASRGRSRALRSLCFADALSGSVGESLLRLRLREFGAPAPVLQQRFHDPGFPAAIVDFWFPEQGIVIEFDGDVKYLDRTMRGDRTAEQVLIDEKRREDRIRARPEVRTVIRICYSELFDLPKLARKLRAAGLPLRRAAL